ncbi:hypothetical protein FQN60_016844 [Etheostoma spectabile]|uniref:Protein kinase domain-containing protein n=1 Tax=Etheostoma spectabile TaxID=54343 RepID=A0A5J5CAD1_9PERO|nr:hypothetical protein FQN60_016844 [Etheostoma spectabile]
MEQFVEDSSLKDWEEIGSGGFGQIYKARHHARPEIIALRIPEGDRPLLDDVTGDAAGLTELKRLMKRCWDQEPERRPTALECTTETEQLFQMHKDELNKAVYETQKEGKGMAAGNTGAEMASDDITGAPWILPVSTPEILRFPDLCTVNREPQMKPTVRKRWRRGDSLQTKVKALETEVKTHKEKAEEWKAQLGLSREDVERISLDKAELLLRFHDHTAKTAQTESELRQQRCDSEANARNTVVDLKAHYQSEIGRMLEGHDKRLAEAKADS